MIDTQQRGAQPKGIDSETWPCRQFHSSGGKKSTTIFFYEDDTSEKSCQDGRLFGKRKQFYFYSGQRQRESIGWKVGR